MVRSARFDSDTLAALDRAKILGVRSGTEHRHTGVWPVVIERRLFVRSWNDKPTGWYRAFRAQPRGSMQLNGRDIAIRGVPVRSARLREAVSNAYARKYDTKASKKWVDGFREPERMLTTLEVVPDRSS